jgi:hypothetical protein
MQVQILTSSLILGNLYKICFTLKNYETSYIFFSKIILYLIVLTLKLSEYFGTHFDDYLLVETLVIYYN